MPTERSMHRRGLFAGLLALIVTVSLAVAIAARGTDVNAATSAAPSPNLETAVPFDGRGRTVLLERGNGDGSLGDRDGR
jgi:hypothetical protein